MGRTKTQQSLRTWRSVTASGEQVFRDRRKIRAKDIIPVSLTCNVPHIQRERGHKCHFLSPDYTPHVSPSTLYTLCHLIHTTSHWGMCIIIPISCESKDSHLRVMNGAGGGGGREVGGKICSRPQLWNSSVMTQTWAVWLPAGPLTQCYRRGNQQCCGSPFVFPTNACFLFTLATTTASLSHFFPTTGKTCNFMLFPHLSLKQAPLFEERPLALGVSR